MTGAEQARALRWRVEDAVKASQLSPTARHVLLTLLTYVDVATGVIPYGRSPSLTNLTRDTGYARSTVAKHLELLAAWGWLDRAPPAVAEQLRGGKTRYRLLLPPGPHDGLVREPDQVTPSPSSTDGPAVVHDADQAGRPPGPDLVREEDVPGPPGGLSTDLDLQTSQTTRAGAPEAVLLVAERLNCSTEQAELCVAHIVASGAVKRSLPGWIRSVPVDTLAQRLRDALAATAATPVPPPFRPAPVDRSAAATAARRGRALVEAALADVRAAPAPPDGRRERLHGHRPTTTDQSAAPNERNAS